MSDKRYLRIISSFDEFATDAEAGVVYYHQSENVYYWLALRTIWGYIGYNVSDRKFYNNGKSYTIIPPVPDPESLTGPVIIDTDSTSESRILFMYSAFNIMPVSELYRFNGKLVVDCNNAYDFNTIKTHNTGPYTFYVEYLNYDLSKIEYITRNLNYYNATLIITINDTNNVFDLDKLTITTSTSSSQKTYTTNLRIVYDKNEGVMSEDMIFDNIDENLDKLVGWNVLVDCTNIDTLKMTLRENLPQPYKCYNIKEGWLLIIDASKSNGVVPNNYYSYFQGSLYVRDIIYQNVTDYGAYYKRYLLSEDYKLLTQDELSIMSGNYIEMYSNAKVTNGDWSKVSKSSVDIDGIKHFVYYNAGGLPTTPVIIPKINSYNDIVTNGIVRTSNASLSYCAISTPLLSNINLESFGFDYNLTNYVYINTNDSDVYIENVIAPSARFNIYPGLANIHISGAKTDYAHGHIPTGCTISIYSMDTLDKGGIYLENIGVGHGRSIQLSINIASEQTEKIRTYIVNCTGLENPTPEDYYNSGVTHSTLFYESSWLSNSYDYAIIRSGYGKNCRVPLNKIKCLYGGGNFVGKSIISSAQDMETMISLIPNITSGATFYFDENQSNYLTTEQIDYLTVELGYTITIQH